MKIRKVASKTQTCFTQRPYSYVINVILRNKRRQAPLVTALWHEGKQQEERDNFGRR